MNRFSKQLSELLAQSNLTQKTLSDKLGVGKNKINCWVRGATEPCIEDLIMLAKFFDVSTDYLVGIEDLSGNSQQENDCLNTSALINVFAANTQGERDLLKYFRKLSVEKQNCVVNLIK